MDGSRFDHLTRSLITATSRRGTLATLVAALVASLLPQADIEAAHGRQHHHKAKDRSHGQQRDRRHARNHRDHLSIERKKKKKQKKHPCQPQCTGKVCGPDGCGKGGACGSCPEGIACDGQGQCSCTPNCGAKVCGPNGCPGGSCGACAIGVCNALGQCVECNSAGDCTPAPCQQVQACEAEDLCVPGCRGRVAMPASRGLLRGTVPGHRSRYRPQPLWVVHDGLRSRGGLPARGVRLHPELHRQDLRRGWVWRRLRSLSGRTTLYRWRAMRLPARGRPLR